MIFFRLWYLQVLSGEQYVRRPTRTASATCRSAAPRGEILDREGKTIVASRTTNAVQIVPSALPPAGAPRLRLYRRLGGCWDERRARIQAIVVRGP